MTQDLIDQFIAEAKRAHAAHPAVSLVTVAHAVTYALNQQAADRRGSSAKVAEAREVPGVKSNGAGTMAMGAQSPARLERAKEYIRRNGEQGYATALDMVIFAEHELTLARAADFKAALGRLERE